MCSAIRTFTPLLLLLALTANISAATQIESDKLHDLFNGVLKDNVDNGRVNYAGINSDDRFAQYLAVLKQANPDNFASDSEKLAFWINAYNALAIQGILDGLSPGSFLGRITYFKTTDYAVGGRSINLYDLEREIIIPFKEPRIHFAIVCASISCPKLRSEAYLAASLEQQLNDNSINFINDPQRNRFDAANKRANLSKIFDWFEKDFKKHSGSVQEFVAQFVQDERHKRALLEKAYRIKYLKYDWNLNGTPAD